MKVFKPGTCAVCKHWEERERLRAARWAKTAEPEHEYYVDAECHKIREKVEILVYGDGYIESVDTDSDFGCILFEESEEENDGSA